MHGWAKFSMIFEPLHIHSDEYSLHVFFLALFRMNESHFRAIHVTILIFNAMLMVQNVVWNARSWFWTRNQLLTHLMLWLSQYLLILATLSSSDIDQLPELIFHWCRSDRNANNPVPFRLLSCVGFCANVVMGLTLARLIALINSGVIIKLLWVCPEANTTSKRAAE